MTRSKRVAACAGLGAIGLVAWQTMAGDLNPPPGQVTATGRTLAEIYDQISLLSPSDCCDNGPWSSIVTSTLPSTPTQVIAGSGLLHAVIMCEGRGIEFYSDNGGQPQYIADLICAPGGSHEKFALNIRFEDGLSASQIVGFGSSSRCTILYRLDNP